MLAVVAIAVAIFIFVPQRDGTVRNVPNTADTSSPMSDSAGQESNQDVVATPFRDTQLERAREKAQETLDEFSALQDLFERNQLGNEDHLNRYNEIIDRANNGDILFSQREFEQALSEFETSVSEMQQLMLDLDADFDERMAEGFEALDHRETESANAAFSAAADIKPLDQNAQVGLLRVARLPKINELLRESERARLRNDWDSALDYLQQAEDLDSLTPGIAERRTRIMSARQDDELNDLISIGLVALNEQDFDEADRLFQEVLNHQPDNLAATTGLQQSRSSRVALKISRLQDKARSEEDRLDLVSALATYDEALAIDSTLEFAIEGRQRVYEIVSLTQQTGQILSDPGALSDDEKFESAKLALAQAEKYRGHSNEYNQTLEELSSLIDYASEFLPVVLVSDNLTEVTLTTQGRLGKFERHEVQLRPGRYELVGSRDGRIDVRETITVERNMAPISIVCEEQI